MDKSSLIAAVIALTLVGCAHREESPSASSAQTSPKEGSDDVLVRQFVRPVPCGINVWVDEDDADRISVDYDPVPTRGCHPLGSHQLTISWWLVPKAGYAFDPNIGIAFKSPYPGGKPPYCPVKAAQLFRCVIPDTAGTYSYTITLQVNGAPGPSLDPRVINN